jgi:hypothetical protein
MNGWAVLIFLVPVLVPVAGMFLWAILSVIEEDRRCMDEHFRLLRENKRLRHEIMLEIIRRR